MSLNQVADPEKAEKAQVFPKADEAALADETLAEAGGTDPKAEVDDPLQMRL
jgi:hypothetical protein